MLATKNNENFPACKKQKHEEKINMISASSYHSYSYQKLLHISLILLNANKKVQINAFVFRYIWTV